MKIKIIIFSFFLFSIISVPALAQGLDEGMKQKVVEEKTEMLVDADELSNMEMQRVAKAQGVILEKALNEKLENSFEQTLSKKYRRKIIIFMENVQFYSDKYEDFAIEIRSHIKTQSDIETQVGTLFDKINRQGKMSKFFLGVSYDDTKAIKKELQKAQDNLFKLEIIQENLGDFNDWQYLGIEIAAIKSVINEISDDINNEISGFSLFG